MLRNQFTIKCYMTTFGQWLTQKRESVGLNQTELANRARVSKNYISLLERDAPSPTSDRPIQPRKKQVEKIAKALNVNINEALEAAGYLTVEHDEPLSMARQVNGSNVRAMGARLQPKDPLDEFEILPSGFEKLSKRQQSKFKKQLRALAQALIDEELDEEN